MPNTFPIKPPAQMPCPHWNHFPIHPQVQVTFGSSCNGPNSPSSPPPTPSSYSYCSACDAMQKRQS